MNLPNLETTLKADILIVDDTPDNLRLLSTMLEFHGYQVRKAINGPIAIRGAQIAKPDLILLDINMPEMDGYEVCQKLKSDPDTATVPIIFISAYNHELDKIKAFEMGAADYITKPFHLQEVLARVENQLNIHYLQKQLKAQNSRLEIEIIERQKIEREIRFLLDITQKISIADNFNTALEITLYQVCLMIDWDFAEAWIPALDGQVLEASLGWYSRDQDLLKLERLREGLNWQYNQGLPGQIWHNKIAFWLTDQELIKENCITHSVTSSVEVCPLLNTLFGLPILYNNEVLAVLIFGNRQVIESNQQLIDLVQAVANQLGVLMQQKKVDAALQKAYLELERLASLDGLTQVANRRKFDQYLWENWQKMLADNSDLSLILCDVDYFKKYNDTYGHLRGDDCLKQIAQAIIQGTNQIINQMNDQPSESLVARYGGEEFAVILPNTEPAQAWQVAQAIVQAVAILQLEHSQSDVSQYVTVSLGVGSFSSILAKGTNFLPSMNSPEQLIAIADQALYQAKHSGRNQIFQS